MHIYAVADIHGRSKRLETIRNNVIEHRPDVVVVAGDIGRFYNARGVISVLDCLPVPVLAVRGNKDRSKLDQEMETCTNVVPIHLKKVTVNDIGFVGFGGAFSVPFDTRLGFNENRILEVLEPLVEPGSIMVTHAPPRGAKDVVMGMFHAGCRNLQSLIKNKKPALLICGHIHESAGAEFLAETLVVNCSMGKSGGGALIEVNGLQGIKVSML